jgi:hypothetical protein
MKNRRHLLIQANPAYFENIEASFRLARQSTEGEVSVSPYWAHHRSLAGFEILPGGGGRVRVYGESGFYFPGRSYSSLEWLNTADRLLWLATAQAARFEDPLSRKAIGFSIPNGKNEYSRFGYRFPGRRTAYDYLRAQYHLAGLAPHLPSPIREGAERLAAVEIGSGTGLLALAVKQLLPNSTIVMVDLPETLPFASIFLTTILPGLRFLFLDGFEKDPTSWSEYDFLLIPPSAAGRLPSQSFHLALNTDSMQEMEPVTIRGYFGLLRRLLRPPSLFYCSNRLEKWTGSGTTKLSDYPYMREDRDIFSRENEFMRDRWIWKKFRSRIPYPWRQRRTNGEIAIQKLTSLDTAGI